MNRRQAAQWKSLFESGNPDGGTTVTAQPDGVHVTLSTPTADLGLAGPGTHQVELRLADDSPFLLFMLARHLRQGKGDA
ncbi:MAG: hypothetical protein ACRDP7_05010 [Trebonia sp.]